MRGSERLVEEYSWMRGICSRLYHSTEKSETFRYRCPSSVFFANRFRSADCQKIQLPLGGSQGVEDLRFYHSMNGCVPSRSGGCYPPLRVRRKPCAYSNQRSTPPLRLAKCRLRRLLACIAPAGASVSPFGLTAPPEVEPRAAAPQAGGCYPPLQRRTPDSGAPAIITRQNK